MPLRIEKINLKLKSGKKYYKPIKYPEIPFSIDDIYVITTDRDRLDLLANQFYNNVDYWWIISNANPNIIKRDSFLLKPGLEIRIPQNIQSIFAIFEKINK
jgi:hypothetical protein|tara:strand:- start:124 stop:426 length:303 start_codon:yes stop_codon:yes gene_type:complete